MKTKLTALTVQSMPLPKEGRKIYWDSQLPCFGVKATPTSKTYIVCARVGGGRESKKITYTVGKCTELSLHEAKLKAQKALADLRLGIDLNTEKAAKTQRDKATSITLNELFEDYISKRTLRPGTLQLYQTLIRLYLSDWQGKSIMTISKSMIEKRLQTLANEPGTRGNRTAQAAQCYRLLRALFAFAAERYEIDGKPVIEVSPTKNIANGKAWNRPQVRDGIIHEEDLKSWYESVVKVNNPVLRDYILWLAFSGMRRTEAMTLRWQDIETKTKKVTVRAEVAKTGKKRDLPLTDMLQSILISRRNERTLTNNFVFPGFVPGKHLIEPRRAINAINKDLKEKKIEIRWSLHDLRRSYASHGARFVPYPALKELLGHSTGSSDITQKHYLRLDLESLRPEAQKITDWLKEKMGIDDGGLLLAAKK